MSHRALLGFSQALRLSSMRPSLLKSAFHCSATAPSASAPVSQDAGKDEDTDYFEVYGDAETHAMMLKDRIRTGAYERFISSNPGLFKGATVLDVGCGTGILSLFAARAGARKVYAIEASKMANRAAANAKENGYENVVTVIRGKAEDVALPEGDRADVAISEWMGLFLTFEAMLPSVISAFTRSRHPSTVMAPSQCNLRLGLLSAESFVNDKIAYWDNVWGFKMPAMKRHQKMEAWVQHFGKEELVSESALVRALHMQTCTAEEAAGEFKSEFTMAVTRTSTARAFLGWFDTFFTSDGRLVEGRPDLKEDAGEVFFSTGPGTEAEKTHWKQTAFLLDDPLDLLAGDLVKGQITIGRHADSSRDLQVSMRWTVERGAETVSSHQQTWKVGQPLHGEI